MLGSALRSPLLLSLVDTIHGERDVVVQTDGATESEPPSRSDSRKFSARIVAALVLMVVVLMLAVVSITLSWWDLTIGAMGIAFTLTQECVNGSCTPHPVTQLQNAFNLTNDLMLIGLVLAVLALALTMVAIFRPRLDLGMLTAGVIGSIVLAAAPAYLYFALPGAVPPGYFGGTQVTSFFGSFTLPPNLATSGTATWGGGSGWYLAWVACAVLLLATLVAFRELRKLATHGGHQ